MPYLLILYYSCYGATTKMAQHIARGAKTHLETRIRTVPKVSTTTENTEPPIPDEGDLYVSEADFRDCAGLAMGSPTRFGNMAAPLKYFLDGTGDAWLSGALIDKPAGVFTSSSTLHGGQETTLISMMLPLLHHGAIIAGVPNSEGILHTTTTGGTPYGPSHVAGPNSDNPLSDDEKNLCFNFGKRLGQLAMQGQKG